MSEIAKLLAAIDYAADRHRNQRRKDTGQTPYVNHLITVADLIANVGGVSDPVVLSAAVLHDVVEDAGVTNVEVAERFCAEVRAIVAEVTDDTTLAKSERKHRQVEHAPHLSARAKLVKLADTIANVRDVVERPPVLWSRERRIEYLPWSAAVVEGLRGVNAPLDRVFDEVLARARATFR